MADQVTIVLSDIGFDAKGKLEDHGKVESPAPGRVLSAARGLSYVAEATPDQIELDWSQPASGKPASYRVYRATAGPVEVHALERRRQLGDHLVNRQHLVTEHVNEFVKHEQVVIAGAQLLDAQRPCFARSLYVLFGVFGVPREAVSHRVDFDAEFFR